MKKISLIIMSMLVAMAFFITACSEYEKENPAVITIYPESSKFITYDGLFTVKGNVKTDLGVIEDISIMCLYYVDKLLEDSVTVIKEEKAKLSSKMDPQFNYTEFRKISESEYEFTLTQENDTMKKMITETHGIRINARTKTHERSTLTWKLQQQLLNN